MLIVKLAMLVMLIAADADAAEVDNAHSCTEDTPDCDANIDGGADGSDMLIVLLLLVKSIAILMLRSKY